MYYLYSLQKYVVCDLHEHSISLFPSYVYVYTHTYKYPYIYISLYFNKYKVVSSTN